MKSNTMHFTDILALLAQIQQEALRLFQRRGLLALFSYHDCSWFMGHASCRQCQAWMFQDQGFQRDRLSDVHLILPLSLALFLSAYHYPMYRSSLPTPLLFPNQSALSLLESISPILHVFQHLTFWPIHPQSFFIVRLHIKLNSSRLI